MKIVDKYIKLTRGESKAIIEWCCDVIAASPKQDDADAKVVSLIDRMREKTAEADRPKYRNMAIKLLKGMVAPHDLWRDRFLAVTYEHETFANLFGIDVPVWFYDVSKRSKAFEQFRGTSDYDMRNLVQQHQNQMMVDLAGKARGIDLKALGFYWEATPDFVHDETQKWREAERAKSQRYRATKKADAEQATAEIAQIPEDTSKLALLREIAGLKAEIAGLKRENTRLRGRADSRAAYTDAKKESLIDLAPMQNLIDEVVLENEGLKQAVAIHLSTIDQRDETIRLQHLQIEQFKRIAAPFIGRRVA